MVTRILRRRREPGSLFEFVDAHVRPGVDGLADGADELPDDDEFSDGGIRFAPGAQEGILAGPGDPDEVRVAVDRIYAALAVLAEDPSAETRRELRERFREGRVRARIDALRDRLAAAPPPHTERLYVELRELFLRSGHRSEVKYAMALVSGLRRPEDADLFRIIGRHEEFTLYAAGALATVTDDAIQEWLALLRQVRGWGRTELSGLILRDPQSELVREQVLRGGLGVGNALLLAEGCRMDEFLARPQVDDELLGAAQAIVDVLVWEWDSPAVLSDYEYAGPAVEDLVRQLSARPRDADGLRTVSELQAYLEDPRCRYDETGGEDVFAACGLDEARLARMRASCKRFLGT